MFDATEIICVMRKNGLSKIAIGVLLACEIGSLETSADLSEFMDAIPGVRSIKGVGEDVLTFTKSSPYLAYMIGGPIVSKLWSSIPSYFSKGKDYALSLFENAKDFTLEEEAKEKLREGVSKIPGFKKSKQEFFNLAKMIAESKNIQASGIVDGENDNKQTHLVLVTGVDNSLRESLVNAFAGSLYTGEVLKLDLTKCESKKGVIASLLPGERDLFSGRKSDTLGDKLEKYKNSNEHGVVMIKLSKLGLKASDSIFSKLLDCDSNGKITLEGKNFETGNLTLVLVVDDDVPDINSLELFKSADCVQLPTENSEAEIATLLKNAFAWHIGFWQKRGINVNKKLFLKSIYKALIETEISDVEKTIKGLVEDFKRYMISIQDKFSGNVLVYYDKELGRFNVRDKIGQEKRAENIKPMGNKELNGIN